MGSIGTFSMTIILLVLMTEFIAELFQIGTFPRRMQFQQYIFGPLVATYSK